MYVSIAVEGPSDATVLRSICQAAGLKVGREFIATGKSQLDKRMSGYNHAAQHAPWVVLRDLDHDANCAPALVQKLLPDPARQMLLRVAVRSVEVWLMADRQSFAGFLGISVKAVPAELESLDRPKRTVVDLARRSSKRTIREEMIPAQGISAEVGPGYTGMLIEYASRVWDPMSAANASDSLMRCLRALQHFSVLRPNS